MQPPAHVVHKSNIDRYIGLLQRSRFDVLIFLTFIAYFSHSSLHRPQPTAQHSIKEARTG